MSIISSSTPSRLIRRYGLFLVALALFPCGARSAWAAQVRIVLPDRTISIPVETVDRHPYVDARAVTDAASGRLSLDRARGEVSVQLGARTLTLGLGRSQVRIGERIISLSSAPLLRGRRVLVPADVIPLVLAERYGPETVEWQPTERLARVHAREVTITQIRTGTYPTHSRVVLDTAGPLEWYIEPGDGGDGLRVLVPGGVLAPTIRPFILRGGLVRAIQPTQHASGAEVRILRERQDTKLRTFTLRNPDRIVIDVLPASGRSAEPSSRALRQAQGPEQGRGTQAEGAHAKPSGETTAAPSLAGQVSTPAPPGPAPRPPSPPDAGSDARQTQSMAGISDRVREPLPAPPSRLPDSRSEVGKSIPSGGGGEPAYPALRGDPRAGDPQPSPPGGGSGILTVVLDPGHGGHDTGAIGATGLREKDVVLDLALRLRRLLRARLGLRVIMTRTEDVFVPLQERTTIANRAKADFFISIHVNGASKRGAVGFETFFFTREPSDSDARASAQRENLVIEADAARGKDQESLLRTILADMAVTRDIRESSELAELMLTSIERLLRMENRGVKSGPFYVLATAAMPAILVESAFITNPREERKLQREAYRQHLAEAMFEGIARYKVRYERRVGIRSGPSAAADS